MQAELSGPEYVYLVWIGSRGQVLPVYPWTDGHWSDRPARQIPVERLSLPDEADTYWNMQSDQAGMVDPDARPAKTPLSEDIDLRRLFAGLSAQPVEDPQALLIFDWGKAVRAEGAGNPPAEKRPPRARTWPSRPK